MTTQTQRWIDPWMHGDWLHSRCDSCGLPCGTYAIWDGKQICFDCILSQPGIEKPDHPLQHVYTLETGAHGWRKA